MVGGLLLVVAGCTYGWWWQAVLLYGGGFITVLCLCLGMVVGFYFVFFYIDGFFNIILMYKIEK